MKGKKKKRVFFFFQHSDTTPRAVWLLRDWAFVMLRGALCSALRASTPRQAIAHGRLAPSTSESRLDSAWRRSSSSSSSRNKPAIASLASADDDGDDSSSSRPPSSPPPPPPNPFYSFLTSTPASRAAAASGTSLSQAPRPARVCRRCDGRGDIECLPCSGLGSWSRGGYSRKNALNSRKAVGTTWTALQRTLGRTHFDCRGKRVVGGGMGSGAAAAEAGAAAAAVESGSESDDGEGEDGQIKKKKRRKKKSKKGGQTYYLMVATCDDEIRLWVPGTTLKDRKAWAAGWLARGDLDALRREVNGGGGGESGAAEEGGEGSEDDEQRPPQGQPRGASCKKCEGTGRVPCPLCSRAGEMIHV